GAPELRAALADGGVAEILECPDAGLGMGHSLAHGAAAASALRPRRLVVALADMPWIDPATIRALVSAADAVPGDVPAKGRDPAYAATIAVPEYRGRRGHPVVFGAAHLDA